uniref:Choline transporter-like protein n=1 Tax=Parascaris equorum TaxID=6256 RepID=A0A914RIC5_PAREQ
MGKAYRKRKIVSSDQISFPSSLTEHPVPPASPAAPFFAPNQPPLPSTSQCYPMRGRNRHNLTTIPKTFINPMVSSRRGCTDVICCFLFIVFIIGWAFVAVLGESLSLLELIVRTFVDEKSVLEKIAFDISVTWWQILTMFLITALIALLWIIIMRILGRFLIWATILFAVIILGTGAGYCWYRYKMLYDVGAITDYSFQPDISVYFEMPTTWLIIATVLSVALLVILITLLFVRTRIALAVALIEESSKAIGCIMSSLLFPIFPFVMHLLAFILWALVTIWLATFGIENCLMPRKPGGALSDGVPCDCSKLGTDSVRIYHLGTIAFGSLILATVKFLRAMLNYLDKKLSTAKNAVAKFILMCLKCCFWCFEAFLKFLTRNAYIMATKDSFMLIMENVLRYAVLDKVTDFLLFLGKTTITLGMGVVAFYWFSGRWIIDGLPHIDLYYYFVPIIIVVVGAYLIADSFFDVYEIAVDTTFLCFLEDAKQNNGTPDKPYYMSSELQRILGKQNQFNTQCK